MDDILTLEQYAKGLNALIENQNTINQKVDSILEIYMNQNNQINDIKQVINQQS